MTNLVLHPNLKLLLYPALFLIEEMEAVLSGRHSIRSGVRSVIVIAGISFGITMANFNPLVVAIFKSINNLLYTPIVLQSATSTYLSVLTFGSIAACISRAATKLYCSVKFGDADYYLTAKREAELESIFKRQGYNVSGDTIRRVVDFCVRNLRKTTTLDLGVGAYDWKRVLDSLLYNADLEVFLEQQHLLQMKLQKTLATQQALIKHSDAINLREPLTWIFHNQTNFNIDNINVRAVNARLDVTELTEQDPLLGNCNTNSALLPSSIPESTIPLNYSFSSLDSLPRVVKEKLLAIKVLVRCEGRRGTRGHQEYVNYCHDITKRQEAQLAQYIFPMKITPLSSAGTTPSSGGSTASNGERAALRY